MMKMRPLLLSVVLMSLVFLSACKMTEEQIRSFEPQMVDDQNIMLAPKRAESDAQARLPYSFIFIALALLAGAVIYFKPDIEVKPKRAVKATKATPKARKSASKRKKS